MGAVQRAGEDHMETGSLDQHFKLLGDSLVSGARWILSDSCQTRPAFDKGLPISQGRAAPWQHGMCG